MGRFLSGFVLGVGMGVGLAMLLTPDSGQATREKLRQQTANYASGDHTLLSTLQLEMQNQRRRFEEAIEVGRRVSAQRQSELWSQLKLTSPEQLASTQPIVPPETPYLPS